jgi:homoaconitate hydratase
LLHLGIPAVIASSFSETYKRNAFNNGLAVFECPALVDYFEQRYAGVSAATIVGSAIAIDYQQSLIRCDDHTFPFPPLSTVAQELVVAGGAENVVKRRLARQSAQC